MSEGGGGWGGGLRLQTRAYIQGEGEGGEWGKETELNLAAYRVNLWILQPLWTSYNGYLQKSDPADFYI